MFSTERSRQLFYGGGDQGFGFMGCGYNKNCETAAFISSSSSGSDIIVVNSSILMAEEESSRNDKILLPEGEKSNSRDDQDWLQLSIGGRRSAQDQNSRVEELELMLSSSSNINKINDHLQDLQAPSSVMISNFNNPPFYNPRNSTSFPQHQFRPTHVNIAAAPPSSSFTNNPSSLASPSYYFPRLYYSGLEMMPQRPAMEYFRVTRPPTRPYSAVGIWFMLQALQNQTKAPFYPQIPKRYLRIKDSKMTVLLVMKYLVNKLKLENESEIEIICKGQRLQTFLTLQHVRDNIWSSSSRDFVTLLPNSSTADHIMVLQYDMKGKGLRKLKQMILSACTAIRNRMRARLMVTKLTLLSKKNKVKAAISSKIHSGIFLNNKADHHDGGEYCSSSSNNNTIIKSAAAIECVNNRYDDDDDDTYPDLTHSLFDEEDDEIVDLLNETNASVIDMVKNSKENFNLEDEIDEAADMFITKFHKRMRLQKLLSFKRYQQMLLERSTASSSNQYSDQGY